MFGKKINLTISRRISSSTIENKISRVVSIPYKCTKVNIKSVNAQVL